MIGVIDYRAGNAPSVMYALDRLGLDARLVAEPAGVAEVDRLILPGVGAARATLASLSDSGLARAAARVGSSTTRSRSSGSASGSRCSSSAARRATPTASAGCRARSAASPTPTASRRSAGTPCASPARTPSPRICPTPPTATSSTRTTPFPRTPKTCSARRDYGVEFCSVVARENLIATQFHAEKSGELGLRSCGASRPGTVPDADQAAHRLLRRRRRARHEGPAVPGQHRRRAGHRARRGSSTTTRSTRSSSTTSWRAPQRRKIDLETVRGVAEHVFVPFTVGGGIRSIDDMFEVLKAGAEKISIDSMAVREPDIIRQGAEAFGRQCIVLSTQVKRVEPRPGHPERLRGVHRRRARRDRHGRARVGAPRRGARRRRDRREQHRQRRHRVGLRPRDHPRGRRRGERPGDRVGRRREPGPHRRRPHRRRRVGRDHQLDPLLAPARPEPRGPGAEGRARRARGVPMRPGSRRRVAERYSAARADGSHAMRGASVQSRSSA